MAIQTTCASTQNITLEQNRLKISDIVSRMRHETLREKVAHFHFHNTELLEVEWARYQEMKANYDKAYNVISQLTPQEVTDLVDKLNNSVGTEIVQNCLQYAQKKEQRQKRQRLQNRLLTVKRILNPLTYLAFLTSLNKQQKSKQYSPPTQQTRTR